MLVVRLVNSCVVAIWKYFDSELTKMWYVGLVRLYHWFVLDGFVPYCEKGDEVNYVIIDGGILYIHKTLMFVCLFVCLSVCLTCSLKTKKSHHTST